MPSNVYGTKLLAAFRTITRVARKDSWSALPMGLKLTEETGELAEATLVEMGLLSKKLKEPIEGEVADVIQCAFSILVKLNPEKSDKEIIALLVEQLNKKTAKWENALDKNTKQPDLYSTRK